MVITILGLVIGVIGLIATLAGTYLAYISLINPLGRFTKYLAKPDGWEKFFGVEQHLTICRYKKYPNFQIVIDWNRPVVEGYKEEWIRDYPDRDHNNSYFVRLEVNSMLLDKELFVSLDGGRGFVPSPRREIDSETNTLHYWYEHKQVQLAKIVGEYSQESNIEEFAERQKKRIAIH